MTRRELEDIYFEWLYRMISSKTYNRRVSYRLLIERLHEIEFEYLMERDGSRAADGIELRYTFGREKEYPDALIASYLDVRPCRVLEMMVALAHRCDDQIMYSFDEGDRTWKWFWEMIENLGLADMTDRVYDQRIVDRVIDTFMEKDYAPNGEGGLFAIQDCNVDMRDLEIWYQMHLYLEKEK